MKDDIDSTEGLTVFKAVYSDAPQSKTVISGLTPHWSPADKISIYDGKNNEFTNTGKSVSATASFSGTLNGKGRKHYLAAYPYSEDLTFSFMGMTVYSLNLPQEQTAVEGSYDPKAAIAVAYSTNQTLAFKNVSSLIRFKVISDGVTSVTVVPNDDTKVLAGTLNATVDGDGLRLAVTESQNTVTLSGEFKKDATYYLATLPASLENGFTVLLNGSIRSYVTDAPVNLTRSGLVDLGTLSLNPSESETPENPGGEEPEPVPTPDPTDYCRLIVKVNKAIDWYDKYIYAWVNESPIIGNWPGTKTNWDKEDGDYYVYYYDFEGSRNGTEINYIISNGNGGGGNQTKDLKVTLNGAETTVHIETSDVQ